MIIEVREIETKTTLSLMKFLGRMAYDIKLLRLALLGCTFHQNLMLCIQHGKQGSLRADSRLIIHLG